MIISQTYSQKFEARKMIPISEYKGPILKLTPKERKEIAGLLDQKTQIYFELDNVRKILEKNQKTITREWQHLSMVEFSLLAKIDDIDRRIKEIKITRLNKQKQRYNTKN